MVNLDSLDVLRALKRCRCLAKQDLVFCAYLDDSSYWRNYALTRLSIYGWLENRIQKYGVNQTYLLATQRYAGLPLFLSEDAEKQGELEALEVFFQIVAGESPVHAKINA